MMRKKMIGALLGLSMVIASVPSVNAKAAEAQTCQVENTAQKGADLYVKNNCDEIIYVTRELADCFDCTKSQWDSLSIGESYVVHKKGEDTQGEIYYYPLINGEDIVLVLSVFHTTDGWSYSFSEDMVSQLNYIDFENNQENYVFYYEENQLIIESEDGVVEFPEEETAVATFDNFALLPARRNARVIYSSGTALEPLTRMLGYYPSFKINESTYKECKLKNPQGQGNYGRCWAAMCATMLNYEFGTPLTAASICDYKGIGYNEGGSVYTIGETLVELGLDRCIYIGQLPWGDIVTEISNKRPVGVYGISETGEDAHTVTVVGYRRIINYYYVIMWNSALNSGQGSTQVVIYDENGTSFISGSLKFEWVVSYAK